MSATFALTRYTKREAGLKPALRKDLVIRRVVRAGAGEWVVKNPETVKYFTFDDGTWALLELFDGTRTPREIVAEYTRRTGFPLDLQIVLDYEETFGRLELLERTTAARNLQLLQKLKTSRQRAAEEKAEGFDLFSILFNVLDPDRFLNRTVKYVRWIWTPPAVLASCLAFAWTALVFVDHWDILWKQTLELYSFLGKPFWDIVHFFFILSVIGCIHEFSHAYVTKIYGGDVHDIGIALLYFTPAFYCDTTDSLLFESKWHRLWVTLAGIYTEALLCTLATALWVASYPDTLLHELAYKTMLFTGVSTVFFNINPLVKIDGYHALTSVVDIPELREESFSSIGALFQRHVLRLPVDVPVLPSRKRKIFLVYGPLALGYIGFVMTFIGSLFLNLYRRLAPDFAVVLLALTMLWMFRKRVRLVIRVARLFLLDKKELLMSRRARPALAAIAAGLVLLLVVPFFRESVEMEAALEPGTRLVLQAPENAVVTLVSVSGGDRVEADQPILTLASTALVAEERSLGVRLASRRAEQAGHRTSAEPAAAFRDERQGVADAASLASAGARLAGLRLRSPIAGRILTSRPGDLLGRTVRAGEPLLAIGDDHTVVAVLPVSERLVPEVGVGALVSMQLRARPLSPIRGTIVSIAPAAAAPTAKNAAPRTARPPEQPERVVAIARFENSDRSLLPGMSGHVKVYGARRSALVRVVRVLGRWVQTVVW